MAGCRRAMTEGSGSSQLVKGAKISPFARFSPEQAHTSPPACCQRHSVLGGPRARAQCSEIRPDKLFWEQQAMMGNSLMKGRRKEAKISLQWCATEGLEIRDSRWSWQRESVGSWECGCARDAISAFTAPKCLLDWDRWDPFHEVWV